MAGVVIVGAGQAGAQLAISLREHAYAGEITLIGDEQHPPYQRPPLSKDYMAGDLPESDLLFRGVDFYERERIDLLTGARVESIQRDERTVTLADGRRIAYDRLVLATGTRNRQLAFDGGMPGNVHSLRTRDDAERLRSALEGVRRVTIVGAGFIGLEFASVAAGAGAQVTVVEMAPRVMARAVSPQLSSYFTERHRANGVDIRCASAIAEFVRDAGGRIDAVRIGDERIPTDLVLVGIGVIANAEIAEAAGLAVDDGIVVDAHLRTADPRIHAIGDCARHPRPDAVGFVRVESVQNAADQARHVARTLTGADAEYGDVAWFWSHQAGDKLQIAGLAQPEDAVVVVGDPASPTRRFSACRLRDGALVAVESVNSAGDHLAARRILSGGLRVSEEQVRAPGFTLREALSTTHAPRPAREHTLERTA